MLQIVRHVEGDERRQTLGEDGRREQQVAAQVGRIQNQDTASGRDVPGRQALEHIGRDLLVFGPRGQAVEAGQIDQVRLPTVRQLHAAGALLDSDAGEVGDFLTQSREPVK